MLAPAAIKRLIEPDEVAELVAYLCSPPAASITGASMAIDGGWTRALSAATAAASPTMAGMAVAEYLELLAREAAAVEFERPARRRPGRRGRRRRPRRAGARPSSLALRVAGAAGAPAAAGGGAVRRCSTPPATWPGCATSTPCCGRSCTGPAQLLGADVAYMTLQRRRARRHLHAGHRRLGVGPVPGAAAADGRRARRPGRPDRRAVRHRQLLRRRAVPPHRRDRRRGRARRAWSPSSGVPLRLGARVIGVLFAAEPQRRGRSPGRRWRCWARWPRTPRSRSTTPGCCRRPGPRWRSCRAANTAAPRAQRRRWSGPRAAHDRMTDAGAARRRGGGRRRGGDRGARRRAAVLDAEGRPAGHRSAPPSRTPAVARGRRRRRAAAGPHRARGDLLGRRGRRRRRDPRRPGAAAATATLADADQRILERAALVTALLLLFRRTRRPRRRAGSAASCSTTWSPGRPRPRRRCATGPAGSASTWTPATSLVVVARADGGAAAAGRVLGRRPTATPSGGLAAAHDGRVVLLLPGDRPGRPGRDGWPASSAPRSAGRPPPARPARSRGPAAVAAAYHEARRCADALLAAGPGRRRGERRRAGLRRAAASATGRDVERVPRPTRSAR